MRDVRKYYCALERRLLFFGYLVLKTESKHNCLLQSTECNRNAPIKPKTRDYDG